MVGKRVIGSYDEGSGVREATMEVIIRCACHLGYAGGDSG